MIYLNFTDTAPGMLMGSIKSCLVASTYAFHTTSVRSLLGPELVCQHRLEMPIMINKSRLLGPTIPLMTLRFPVKRLVVAVLFHIIYMSVLGPSTGHIA